MLLILFSCSTWAADQTGIAPNNAFAKSDTTHLDTSKTAPVQNGGLDAQKIKIVKRHIDAKEYVGLAVGMMVFIAVILTSIQAWNPGSQQ